MNKYFLLLTSFLFLLTYSFAQEEAAGTLVQKPTYFDVSPPLRDMVRNLPANVDESWKGGVVKNQFISRINKENQDNNVYVDPGLQSFNGTRQTDTTIVNFLAISNTEQLVPPDTYGDVGPNHYFHVVNSQFVIFDKSGTLLLGPLPNSSIWSGFPDNENSGDGIVLYDEVADRWLFSQFSLPHYPNGPFYEMIAVSQTNDPTGSWNRYQYEFSDMPDYPKLGVWTDGYYMSCNRFTAGAGNFAGTGAVAFNRTKMLAGDPDAEMIYKTLSASNEAYAFLPSDCDGTFPPDGTPNYFTYVNDGPDRLGIYAFHADFTTPANSTFTLEDQLTVNAFTSFPWSSGLTQKGSSVKLAALGDRLMARLQFRVFSDHWSMVTNHSVNVGGGISGVRWYEMRKSVSSDPWSIYQQGTYNPDNNNRWMGSIAMDSDGNMALGYSIASANLYPSIRYTGRMNGDLPGEMTIAEAGIMNGGGAQTNNWQLPGRWGDYSSMTVDPAQPSTFWYTQEYYSSTASYTWKTRIASFSFANIFNVILSADPDSLCLKDLGSTQLNSEPSGGSGSYTYSWTSNPTGFISSEKSPVTSPEVTTYYLCTVDDGTQTKTDSVLVTVIAPPNVFAGNDTSYCWYIPAFPLNGVIDFYDHVKWETSGDGHFNIDTVANTLYFTGQGDKDLGHVTLTLYAYLEGMCPDTTSDAITVILDPCTGIPQPSAENLGISIQPNPARNLFTLTIGGIKSNSTLITITDMQGRTVLSEKVVGAGTTIMRTIDVSEYRKGAYLVKVQTDKEISTERLIIQ